MFYDSFNFDAVFVASGVAIYSSLVRVVLPLLYSCECCTFTTMTSSLSPLLVLKLTLTLHVPLV